MQFHHDDYFPTGDEKDTESFDTKLSRALIELWQPNSETISEEIEEPQQQEDHQRLNSFLDETAFLNILLEKEGKPSYVPLSTNLGLNLKRRRLCFPMDFGELTLDGLIDTGAHSSAIPEADLRKIRLLAPQSIVKEEPAPSFQILIANGDLETAESTVEVKTEGDTEFHEICFVIDKLCSPIIGLMFLQRTHTVLDMSQSITKLSLFLNAIEESWPQVLQCHETHLPPRGRIDSAEWPQSHYNTLSDLCRERSHRDIATQWPFAWGRRRNILRRNSHTKRRDHGDTRQ